MINSVLAIIVITTGDATSDVVTIAAIIGIAVILLVNLILDNRGGGMGQRNPCSYSPPAGTDPSCTGWP